MKVIKLFLTIFVIIAAVSAISLWYNVYVVGGYYATATIFMAAVMGCIPALVVILAIFLLKAINTVEFPQH